MPSKFVRRYILSWKHATGKNGGCCEEYHAEVNDTVSRVRPRIDLRSSIFESSPFPPFTLSPFPPFGIVYASSPVRSFLRAKKRSARAMRSMLTPKKLGFTSTKRLACCKNEARSVMGSPWRSSNILRMSSSSRSFDGRLNLPDDLLIFRMHTL